MHRDALGLGDDADDLVSRQWMAAAGEMHGNAGAQPNQGEAVQPGAGRAWGAGPAGGRPWQARDHARHAAALAQLRVGGVDDVLGSQVAVADGDIEIIPARELQSLEGGVQHLLGTVDPFLPERLRQGGAPGIEMGLPQGLGQMAADARPCLAGDDETLP